MRVPHSVENILDRYKAPLAAAAVAFSLVATGIYSSSDLESRARIRHHSSDNICVLYQGRCTPMKGNGNCEFGEKGSFDCMEPNNNGLCEIGETIYNAPKDCTDYGPSFNSI